MPTVQGWVANITLQQMCIKVFSAFVQYINSKNIGCKQQNFLFPYNKLSETTKFIWSRGFVIQSTPGTFWFSTLPFLACGLFNLEPSDHKTAAAVSSILVYLCSGRKKGCRNTRVLYQEQNLFYRFLVDFLLCPIGQISISWPFLVARGLGKEEI